MHDGRYNWFVANAVMNRVLPCWAFILALSADAFPLTSRAVRLVCNGLLVLVPAADLYTLRAGKLGYLPAAPVISWFLYETTTAQLQSMTATNICVYAVKYCVKVMFFRKRLQLLSAPYSVVVTRSNSDSSGEVERGGDANGVSVPTSAEMSAVVVATDRV